jgi:hypothetical protein
VNFSDGQLVLLEAEVAHGMTLHSIAARARKAGTDRGQQALCKKVGGRRRCEAI